MSLVEIQRYWDQSPCNVRHSPLPVGTREYFDEVEQRKYFVEPHIPNFAEFKRWNGKRVLEIGCGIGTDAINFARAGAKYTGVDVSLESIRLVKKRFELYNLTGDIIQCNAEEIDKHVTGPFDLIYSFGVLHHTPHPEAVVKAIKYLLAPDGELRIMLYATESWKNIMIEAGLDQPEAQTGCPLAKTYTKSEVETLLCDFKVMSITQDHIFPYEINAYKCYKYVRQPWFRCMSPQMFSVLEHKLGWHMLIKARL